MTTIRLSALAVIVGMIAAAGSLYALGGGSAVAVWTGASAPASDVRPVLEDFPVCTSMGAAASEAGWAELDPDFVTGTRALIAEDWKGGIAAFELAALRDPQNADIQNHIGYAYRRLREFGPAMQHYQRALAFNPRHRSAHEHVGELNLALGEPARAEQQLATLQEICLIPCREQADLARAIAIYTKFVSR